jgi:membrane-associated phospholipid phosphatase
VAEHTDRVRSAARAFGTVRRHATPRSVLIVTTATLLALTLTILLAGTTWLDQALRDAALNAVTPGAIQALRIANLAGDWKILLPATVLLIATLDRARRTWWIWVALMVAAPVMEWTLKHAIARPRPENTSFGFPSGHATAIAAYTGAVLALTAPAQRGVRTATWCAILSVMLLVGFARVVLRAHWPSDVAGGFALGLALSSLATMLATKVDARSAD